MENEQHHNTFKDGLEPTRDHSAWMEKDWSLLEQRLERQEGRKVRLLWAALAGAVAVLLLLLFTWVLVEPDASKPPKNEVVTVKKPQPDQKAPAQDKTAPLAIPTAPLAQRGQTQVARSLQRTITVPLLALPEKVTVTAPRTSVDTTLRLPVLSGNLESPQHPIPYRRPPTMSLRPSAVGKASQPRLSLSLTYAPALNGVGTFRDARLGHDLGLLFHLRLAERWSISTGAIYARKNYESAFSRYNPDHKAQIPYVPDGIYADCRVLDIPLNVTYKVWDKGRNSISLSTGLSSYLMLREDYRLTYKPEDGLNDYRYSIRNKNQHVMGVVNLEATYQHRLNAGMAVGLQPYVKLPISEIGYGNVKLQSLGVAVHLNISLGSKAALQKNAPNK